MTEPRWLDASVVLALHDESLAMFGGAPGMRDRGLLESALARPRHRWAYEPGVDRHALAASYAFGLARNHPFVDGNKRVSVLSIAVFLGLNGETFDPPEDDEVRAIQALAAGALSEEELVLWVQAHTGG